MNLYLVRETETTKVHGILWAETPASPWDAMDEMGDPSEFEWAEVTMASGVWREGSLDEVTAIPDRSAFPASAEGEEAFDEALTKSLAFGFNRFGDHFWQMLVHQDEHVWTRFDSADQGVGVVVRLFQETNGQS